jgi:hypothetical protein
VIINDDILKWCAAYKGEQFHALLCDPPYHLTSISDRFSKSNVANEEYANRTVTVNPYARLSKAGFMGKEWDGGDIAFRKETWIALSEHLYDGAFIMAFASSRGFHRMAVAMEDAGLIAHPFIGYIYGSGFPKATRIDTQLVSLISKWYYGSDDERTTQISKHNMQSLPETNLPQAINNKEAISGDLLTSLSKQTLYTKGEEALAMPQVSQGGSEPILEGRIDIQKTEGELQEREVRKMPRRISTDGEEGWLCYGTQIDYGKALREIIETQRGSPPHRPQSSEQLRREFDTLSEQQRTQKIRSLADIWIGHRYGLQALKPALEPILVFQKPYKGKPIDCITKSGAGCLNIDGGRIGEGEDRSSGGLNNKRFDTITGTLNFRVNQDIRPIGGRWPANVVLSHTPECRQIGVKNVGEGKLGGYNYKGEEYQVEGFVKSCKPEAQSNRGIETVADWECPDYCPIRRLGEQSGETSGCKPHKINSNIDKYEGYGTITQKHGETIGYDGKGTASRYFYNTNYELENTDPFIYQAKASRSERDAGLNGDTKDIPYAGYRENFADTDSYVTKYPDGRDRPMNKPRNNHPTIKPIKLTQHLATLLLPPKEYTPRRLLVPFAGVGSEMIGALLVGWEDVIGIELDPEYCKMAEERIKYWTTQSITKPTNNKEQLELPL